MRRLLASTALVLMTAGSLAAQQAPDGAAREGMFLPSTVPDALYASELIGMDVSSSETDYAAEYGDRAVEPDVRSQWDDIGEINDIVLSPAGDIQAVLVDIGGFLGIGTRTVALDMNQLHFLRDDTDVSFAADKESGSAESVPIVEEGLVVGKAKFATGGVRVTSSVEELPVEETVTLREERVSAEQRPADRELTAEEAKAAFEEKTVEVIGTTEEARVSKTARVVGEVALEKAVEEREETVRDTVRKTDVQIEEVGTKPRKGK